MSTFYDYNMMISRKLRDAYVLCANMKPLEGAHCWVYREGDVWCRRTQWAGTGGRRYVCYDTLDEALTAGVVWARRREREDAKGAA